jgi:hypothetical protein
MKASALILIAGVLPACTAKNAAYEKQLVRLNETVAILQNERDRLEERIAVLEAERETVSAQRQRPPGPLERPRLEVVQLLPPSDVATARSAPVAPVAPGEAVEPRTGEPPAQGAGQSASRALIHGSGTELHWTPTGDE